MKLEFIEQIENKLSNILEDNSIEIIRSKNSDFGDYSLNLALKLSKIKNKNPMDIAEDIKESISDIEIFTDVNVTKPGFVNFKLKNNFLINSVNKFKDETFKPDFKIDKKKINYEFISANPTGDLHIGHLRNAVVGDIISNLLTYIGNIVDREYWINDSGNQITTMAESVYFYLAPLLGKECDLEKENVGYHGVEIIAYAKELAQDSKEQFLELTQQGSILKLSDIGVKHFLQRIKDLLLKIKVKEFRYWTSEKEMIESGKTTSAINKLEDAGALYIEDGAKWLKTKVFGDDKDRVLIKRNGDFTYMTSDVANHIQKYGRGYDQMINLWGKDHYGYQTRILASMWHLKNDPDKLKTDFINMVQIEDKGEKVKMSKRAGTSLRIKDILESLPVDVARYFIISKSKEQNLSININEIREQHQDNPYFYVQYAHARANQLVNKYKQEVGAINIKAEINISLTQERDLLKKIFEFGDVVIQASKDREPFILVSYIKELAQAFNSFYGAGRIIGEEKAIAESRIQITILTMNVMKRIFKLIGIEPIEKM